MKIKQVLCIIAILFTTSIFSQKKSNLSGKVLSEGKSIPDVTVVLSINNNLRFSISEKNGKYNFINIDNSSDSIFVKVNYLGYKPFIKKIKLEDKLVLDINLIKSEPEILNEVVIKGKEKIINTARKSSYKIDSKDFIANAKATEVLNIVPNVFYNESTGVLVDGNLEGKVFIDGVALMKDELKSINATDIDRVEVMNNPSAVYGTDFTGAIINIVTKKNNQEFIKGSIEGMRSVKYNNWYLDPSISYKRGRFVLKTNMEYQTNNQFMDNQMTRTSGSDLIIQNFTKNTKGAQKYINTRFGIKLTDKSNLTFTNHLFSYIFSSDNIKGNSSLNNIGLNFDAKDRASNADWDIASVYNYKFTENKNLLFKALYTNYSDKNNGEFLYSSGLINNYNVESKNKDFSGAVDYEAEELTVFNKKSGFYTGAKYINRNFKYYNSNFYVAQNVINFYSELDTEWTENFSTELNMIFENTNNRNDLNLNQKYNFILPTFNFLYHFKNKLDCKFGYSRRILRPSADDLNEALVIFSPNVARRGNANLLPQIRNYYFLSFNKSVKSNVFSIKLFNTAINNSIEDVFTQDNSVLIQSVGNVASYNSTGFNIGIRTKIFKKINANLNTGIDYSQFTNNDPLALVKSNNGYSYRGSLNLSTKLFKDKLSVSLSGNQNAPNYYMSYKRIATPYIDLRLATNLFKDKINLGLYARNNAIMKMISNSEDFYQRTNINYKSSNVQFSITYNFGKKFDDSINENDIQNDDIRK